MSNFRVGMKVVCVDDVPRGDPDEWDHVDWPLKRGGIYTVAGTKWEDAHGGVPCNTLFLAEATRGLCKCCNGLVGYDESRFRPVAEKPTSMDIIRAIVLDPSKPIEDDPREPVITPVPEYEQGWRL